MSSQLMRTNHALAQELDKASAEVDSLRAALNQVNPALAATLKELDEAKGVMRVLWDATDEPWPRLLDWLMRNDSDWLEAQKKEGGAR